MAGRARLSLSVSPGQVRRGTELAARKADYAAGLAKGAAHVATEPVRKEDREYDDVTLARKVESAIFRPEDAPKGA